MILLINRSLPPLFSLPTYVLPIIHVCPFAGQNVRCESRWSLLGRPRVALALINLVAGIAIIGFYISRAGAHVALMVSWLTKIVTFTFKVVH